MNRTLLLRCSAVALTALTALAVLAGASLPAAAQDRSFDFEVPRVMLRGVPVTLGATGPSDALATLELRVAQGTDQVDVYRARVSDGVAYFDEVVVAASGITQFEVWSDASLVVAGPARSLPAWLSVLPALLAIGIAIALRQVIIALFVGLWFGATALIVVFPGSVVVPFGPSALVGGLFEAFQVHVLGAVTDPSHAQILLFSFMIGGTVGIIMKNGGMQGVVNIIVRFATDARRGQISAATLGVAIFFDDYANTLVVGNTMRQVTDRLRVSREKLAYIVDSTAAPVACVALVTTWIGYEVGLIGSTVESMPDYNEAAYSIFLNSVAYSFYPFLTIFFVFTLAVLGRDFGPMHAAETRARSTGEVLSAGAQVDDAVTAGAEELQLKEGMPTRAVNGIVPIVTLMITVMAAFMMSGSGESLRDIIGSADSYQALMWGSLASTVMAGLMSLGQRLLTLTEIVDAWYSGIKTVMYAMVILVLAWALASVSEGLHSAEFLVSILGEALHPGVVPALVFVLAAATAFATGSSWSTMAILMPLVLPLSWAVLQAAGSGFDANHVIYSTVACVLAGAVMGDHCSPISDTTILSSMASGCDHIEHVRTQLPYALTVGAVGTLLGTLPAGFGMPWWIGMILGAVTLYVIARYVGRPIEA